jgi:hypothetical protein
VLRILGQDRSSVLQQVIRSPYPRQSWSRGDPQTICRCRFHLKLRPKTKAAGVEGSNAGRFVRCTQVRAINSSYLPLVLPLVPLLSLPEFDEPVELSSVRFGIVVKPESPEILPFVPPFSLELIEGDGVLPDWPSERVVSFERQTCVGPLGEYSAALPGAGAGAGGMGAGCVFGLGAIIGTAPGAPQLGATVPQPQLGA